MYRHAALRDYQGEKVFSHLVTFGDHEDDVAFTGFTECVHWVVEDPAVSTGDEATRVERFRRTRDQISARIQRWLEAQRNR